MSNSIIKNYIYNSGLLIFNLVFPFITMIYVNRIFSIDIIGEISLVLSFVTVFTSLSSLGISLYGMREVAQNRESREKLEEILSKYLILNIAGVLVFTVLYFNIIFFYLKKNMEMYIILYLNILMSPFLIEWFYIGLEQYKYITKRSIFVKLSSFIFMIIFIKKEEDIYLYLMFLVLGSSLNGIFNIYKAKNYIKKVKINFINELLKLKYFYLQIVIGIFYNGCEQIILGLNSTSIQVAYYSRSKQLLGIPSMIILSLTRTLLPSINNKVNNKKEYKDLFKLSFSYMCLLMFPCISGILILSDNILYIIGGEKFIPAKNILKISTLLLSVSSMSVFLDTNISVPNKKEKNTLYGNVGVMIITIILSILLSSKYGGEGTALSVVIGEMIGVLIQFIFIKKQGILVKFLDKNIFKYIGSSVFMGILLLSIQSLKLGYILEFFISVLVGAIFYFLLLFLMKEKLIMIGYKKLKVKLGEFRRRV